MFIDASAMVAILTNETKKAELIERIAAAEDRVTSAIAIWETTVRVMSKREFSERLASKELREFLELSEIDIVSIGEEEARLATEAFSRYGKGRHRAALNMGDCFAYACAKANDMPLLYIGNDFSRTDVNSSFERRRR